MPFRQSPRPALAIDQADLRRLRGALLSLGYRPTSRPETRRPDQTGSWTRPAGDGREVHVQETTRAGIVRLYAHTEPAGALAHLASAILDRPSWSAGSRQLRADLRALGWRF